MYVCVRERERECLANQVNQQADFAILLTFEAKKDFLNHIEFFDWIYINQPLIKDTYCLIINISWKK